MRPTSGLPIRATSKGIALVAVLTLLLGQFAVYWHFIAVPHALSARSGLVHVAAVDRHHAEPRRDGETSVRSQHHEPHACRHLTYLNQKTTTQVAVDLVSARLYEGGSVLELGSQDAPRSIPLHLLAPSLSPPIV